MKKCLIIITVLAFMQFFNSCAMLTYEIAMDVISTNTIERFPSYIVTDIQPYVNGGLIITYPAGLFTAPPVISLTISAALHPSNITYTAEVCLENMSSCTIMVYENNSGVLTEAPTSSVNVNFVAIGI
jgi:hypothetical protein